MSIKICIDPGHYGKYNQSPANSKYYESDFTWKISLLQKKYLEQYGITVVLTKNSQAANPDLRTRGRTSNGCHLFISNHSNATGSGINNNIDYPASYCTVKGTADYIGLELASIVQGVLQTSQKARIEKRMSNIVPGQDYYGVLVGASQVGTPGLILEHSFHTNTRITNLLLDDSILDRMAKAQADKLAEYYKVTKPVTVENKWILKEDGTYQLTKQNGQLAKSEWIFQNHRWYYFNSDGIMLTGWNLINNEWFFMHDTKGSEFEGACYHESDKKNGSLEIWYIESL